MGKRYSDGTVNERPYHEGAKVVKKVSLEVKQNIKILLILLLIPIIGVGSYLGYKTYLKSPKNNNKMVVPAVPDEQEESQEDTEEYVGGYQVIGGVQIEKIGLDGKILDPKIDGTIYMDDALRYGIVKLYGEEINEIGNFSIIAHDTNEFARLNELIIGDEIIISNENDEKMNYIVTEIMHVAPEDLTVLLPNEYETEITLITCEDGAATRLVVKAVNN